MGRTPQHKSHPYSGIVSSHSNINSYFNNIYQNLFVFVTGIVKIDFTFFDEIDILGMNEGQSSFVCLYFFFTQFRKLRKFLHNQRQKRTNFFHSEKFYFRSEAIFTQTDLFLFLFLLAMVSKRIDQISYKIDSQTPVFDAVIRFYPKQKSMTVLTRNFRLI